MNELYGVTLSKIILMMTMMIIYAKTSFKQNTTYQSLWVTIVLGDQMVKQLCSSKPCCQQDTGRAILSANIDGVRCTVMTQLHLSCMLLATVLLTFVTCCTSKPSSWINQSTSSMLPPCTAKCNSVHSS